MAQKMKTSSSFETLSGAALMKMQAHDFAALSRDELVRLAMRSRAILTAVATLSADYTVDRLSVSEVLNMMPQDIIDALNSDSSTSSTTSSTSSSLLLSSEPLPWRPNTRPKLPPGALLDIPDDLLWDLFTEWLPIEAVCGLDSALCQKSRRPEFLALVSNKVLLFNRETVDVLGSLHLTTTMHRPLGAAALSWILKRGIHLASLYLPIGYKRISRTEKESICESVAALALDGRLAKLETINLYNCNYIKDADLAGVLSKCYSPVKSIDIRGCRGLSESSAVHVKRCTKLEAFAAKGNESAAEMVEIFQACRKLRSVNLSSFRDRLTDEVVQSVGVNCHLLERLSLTWCSAVSDAGVRKVAESCPLLQYVSLSQANITDATVVALCNRCPLLKQMYLYNCVNLTDAAVMAVAERLPGLTHIYMAGITAITSNAVETLVSKCRELEDISLADLPNVSDVTLKKIAEYSSNLVELYVSGCARITTAGLAMIAMKCSGLKSIYLNRCPQISAEQCATLKELFPLVSWIDN